MSHVTLKDPIERGLKGAGSKPQKQRNPCCYTQRPDRKGTERHYHLPYMMFTIKGYTQRPDRKGTESIVIGDNFFIQVI